MANRTIYLPEDVDNFFKEHDIKIGPFVTKKVREKINNRVNNPEPDNRTSI